MSGRGEGDSVSGTTRRSFLGRGLAGLGLMVLPQTGCDDGGGGGGRSELDAGDPDTHGPDVPGRDCPGLDAGHDAGPDASEEPPTPGEGDAARRRAVLEAYFGRSDLGPLAATGTLVRQQLEEEGRYPEALHPTLRCLDASGAVDEVATSLAADVTADFDAIATVVAGGWVLARTEAHLCVVAEQLPS